ncbi:isocitrate lyase/PEP mutase family protein [Natronosalvus caseinilyticus]|uniref:isocitrate lyase/PEP mutase family protein n=1 Tax=Natronosalvus caseinilyticus TaxID=2953747 RepID=UPI0028ABC0AF|nr:isocitrate lyase/PEP mutase family protein [Natronosalvus caseinilyticus]
MRYSTQLKERLEQDEILVCPGSHDPLTARVIDKVGFDAAYMTGYGTSLSTTGYPDSGLITMTEMVRNARNIQETIDVPLIADADNGFGNAVNTIRTVREYINAGLGGIQIEDQTFPKRCGHVEGRQVIGREEAVGKVEAAASVRDERDEDFVIIARTDALGAVDGTVKKAISRANAFLDAGADVAFVEGPTTTDEVEEVGAGVDGPLLYNCTGISPLMDADELESAGFDILLYPGICTRTAIISMYEAAVKVKSEGTDAVGEVYKEMDELPIGGLHEFSGFPQIVEWEEQFLPETEQEKYEDTLGESITD